MNGIPTEMIDGILQDMVGYNNKISPYYMPRTSVEEIDGKVVLVIWCPAGINRPYSVPENVTAKSITKEYFYIRSGTSSIIAKGEVLDELRELVSRIPFDERGNPDIKVEDISTLLLRKVSRKNQDFTDSKQIAKTGNNNGKNRLKYRILQKSEIFPLFAMALSVICRNFGAKSLLI